jgi:hypothetical protein
MKTAAVRARLRRYFTELPAPLAVFQVGASAFAGLRLPAREGGPVGRFVQPLPKGLVQPSLDRTNITDPGALEGLVIEGLTRLGLHSGPVALLLPELCARVFIVDLDSRPTSAREEEDVFRWRVKKQFPLLPEDARWSLATQPAGAGERIVGVMARAAVVQEYEALFARTRVRVRTVTLPSLSLARLLERTAENSVVQVNAEETALTVTALVGNVFSLHRLKPLAADAAAAVVAQEAENTIHFLEDREQTKVQAVWVRSTLPDGEDGLIAALGERLGLPVRSSSALTASFLEPTEGRLLGPLAGVAR